MKNNTKKTVLVLSLSTIIFLLLSLLYSLFAQMDIQNEYLIKSAFLYNFSKYIQWDQKHSTGPFVIGVLGQSEILGPLEGIAQKKKVAGRSIEIKKYSKLEDIQTCHILFVSTSDRKEIERTLDDMRNIKKSNILIVTDSEGGAEKGAALNFIIAGGKVRFELNDLALKRAGLEASSQLKKIAVMIKEE